jgi:hypothetical protein
VSFEQICAGRGALGAQGLAATDRSRFSTRSADPTLLLAAPR